MACVKDSCVRTPEAGANTAFRNLLGDARFFDVPMILETPKGTDAAGRDYDRLNLRRLRLIARRAAAKVG